MSREREAPRYPKGQTSGQSIKLGTRQGCVGDGGGPLGLQGTHSGLLLPHHPARTCEGPCVSGLMEILLGFGDHREKESSSWTP